MLRSRPSPIPALPVSGFPAKTYTHVAGVSSGREVQDHCHIVGATAKELIARYPVQLQQLFPAGAPLAAASHDIGKISPTFYEKLRRNITVNAPPPLDRTVDPEMEKLWGGHAGVSEATASMMGAPQYVPEILGMHHGFSPQLGGKTGDAEPFGGRAWHEARVQLVHRLQQELGMTWPEMKDHSQARLVAGLTSVADWIGSGQHFEDPGQTWDKQTIKKAVTESGFVTPSYKSGLSFEEVFGFAPNPTQSKLEELSIEPGVYIVEAPMGLGKTEAALYAAYNMLQKGLAAGVYFALPTQLTSNKIYGRFNQFLTNILNDKCPHKKALLLHGNAWLVETEMGEEGRPGGSWFDQSKRGLLAPFAVGTIDQALMAVLNVKHGFVRALGLAGKVVILDEVHTYDAYTGTLLDALIQFLRSLRCTVIVLSATLNQTRRQALIGQPVSRLDYPLITAANDTHKVLEVEVPSPQDQTISLQFLRDTTPAMEEALKRAQEGQFVLWLENTVGEAQQQYLDFAARAAELQIPCGLLHSRFTAGDRQQKETEWVRAYGKEGWPIRHETGRILVGTQVLEQSLDIDADFLVTRFAPTDMLLQRLGRLWRHAHAPRHVQAQREAWLLAPELNHAIENPIAAFGPSAWVYAPYVLCRSLQVWTHLTQVTIPKEIRTLIEATYAYQDDVGHMARWYHELEHGSRGPFAKKGRMQLQQLAWTGLASGGKTLPEEQAATRYSETDTCDVLLLKEFQENYPLGMTSMTLLDNTVVTIPHKKHQLSKKEWKLLTGKLITQSVTVGAHVAPEPLTRAEAQSMGLGHCFPLGDGPPYEKSMLRLAISKKNHRLLGLRNQPAHTSKELGYRKDLGYYTSELV